MPLARSALASRAARDASAGSAPTCGAISAASFSSRRTRSPWRAELGVEHDAVELRQEVFELPLPVQIPEEPRVGQPRAQHALVARHHRGAAVRRLDVGHHGEARRGAAIGAAEREVLLVRAHGGAHDLGRQVHEGVVDAAEQRHRPLDQARHLRHQRLVRHHLQPLVRGKRGDAFSDQFRPFRRVEHHPALAQARPRTPRSRARRRRRAP